MSTGQTLALAFTGADWWALVSHFLTLSLMAVGGAITTAPDMHRYLVVQQSWLSDAQFNASIALAQAAPGPNVLFVAITLFMAFILKIMAKSLAVFMPTLLVLLHDGI